MVACKSLCVCVRARTQMQKDMEIVSAEAFVEEGCVQWGSAVGLKERPLTPTKRSDQQHQQKYVYSMT